VPTILSGSRALNSREKTVVVFRLKIKAAQQGF